MRVTPASAAAWSALRLAVVIHGPPRATDGPRAEADLADLVAGLAQPSIPHRVPSGSVLRVRRVQPADHDLPGARVASRGGCHVEAQDLRREVHRDRRRAGRERADLDAVRRERERLRDGGAVASWSGCPSRPRR